MKPLHYGTDEWLAYKLKTSTEEKMAAMESHLEFCASCQEIYLDLIDQPDLDMVQQFIPPDFTKSLMNSLDIQLSNSNIVKFPARKQALNRKGIFAYYVTAAVITLVLMSGGIFDSMVDQSMRFTHICMVQSHNVEAKVNKDWNWQLVKHDSLWMNNRLDQERNVKDAKQE